MNVITLGSGTSDRNNIWFLFSYLQQMGPKKSDTIKRLMTLTVITIRGFHCTDIYISNYKMYCTLMPCETRKFSTILLVTKLKIVENYRYPIAVFNRQFRFTKLTEF